MKALCKLAGVAREKVFPHNLRHLFARTFYGIEKNLSKLADLLGHSSIETTRIYIMESGAEHQRLLEQITCCYKRIRKYSFVSIICHVPPFSRDDLPGKTYRTENRAQKSRLGKNRTLVQPDFRVIFYESLRDKAYLLDFLYRPCYYVGVIPQPVEGYCFTFCAVDFFVQI